jgi:hypothetical protein
MLGIAVSYVALAQLAEERDAARGRRSGAPSVVTLTLRMMSFRRLSPESIQPLAAAPAVDWMPGTSPGMTKYSLC